MDDRAIKFVFGVIALVADLIGIITFILSGQAGNFWSATWMVMLFGIGSLLGISLFFLKSSQDQRSAEFLPIASAAYGLLSCVGILSSLYMLGGEDVGVGSFIGMIVLIIFPSAMAKAISSVSDRKANRSISYLYAGTGILAIIGLMFRYMQNPGFSWWIIGEFLILGLVGIGFDVFSDHA